MPWGDAEVPAALVLQTAQWIGMEPSLAAISAEVVDDIHLLRASSGYDVSHSEPRWRRRIFVSVPERHDDVGALRLAESIVHEAMHLHLTNTEMVQLLVVEFHRRIKSPWRAELRSYQGVLHGLFVFTCLEVYFRRLAQKTVHPDAVARHCKKRVDEIRAEIESLDISRLCEGLTPLGAILAQQWHKLVCSA